MYDTYGGEILITDERGQAYLYTFKVRSLLIRNNNSKKGDLFVASRTMCDIMNEVRSRCCIFFFLHFVLCWFSRYFVFVVVVIRSVSKAVKPHRIEHGYVCPLQELARTGTCLYAEVCVCMFFFVFTERVWSRIMDADFT